ncbi:MAG: hypothetical protein WC049_08950, partial [Candidatus Ratteibacteria bacterium]
TNKPRFSIRLRSATRWQSCLFVGLPDFAQFKSLLKKKIAEGEGFGAPLFRNVRGRPSAKIAALARNLSTSLNSNPF